MAREDRGMRLSTRGLSLTGEQVVKVENSTRRDELFVLVNNTTVESYTYDPLSDTGFTPSGSYNSFKVRAMPHLIGTEKIMEIAGGIDTLKVRYDNGLCLVGVRTSGGDFIIEEKENIARITKNNEYSVLANRFYKTGAGVEPLMALLDGDGTTEGAILAVFEGERGDYQVTIADAMATAGDGARVGKVGDFTVFSKNGSLKIKTSSGDESISGYGTIVRKMDATSNISLGKQIDVGASVIVDYSAKFSPDHYTYITNNRKDFKNSWLGVGNVGYVVDLGKYAQMKVPISGLRTAGRPPLIPTRSLNDTIEFIIVGGVLKKVEGATLTDMPTSIDDSEALIAHIYHTDMSQEVVMVVGNETVEPFSVNGYFFGYGDDHLVDVDLTTL